MESIERLKKNMMLKRCWLRIPKTAKSYKSIQKAQWIPARINKKKSTSSSILKYSKNKDILKESRDKRWITTKECTSPDFWVSTMIPETVDKSAEYWVKIHCQHRTVYLEKNIFHIRRWNKNSLRFSKTKKVSSRHLLEDFLQDVFQENDLPRKSKMKKWILSQ